MFDKLIESNSAEAEFRPRGRFFLVVSAVVGVLFITAVVVSLYAQDFSLGTDQFDITGLMAPVAPQAPEPPPADRQPQPRRDVSADIPVRTEAIQRLDDSPIAPTEISTKPNTVPPIPDARFRIGTQNINVNGTAPPTIPGNVGTPGTGSSADIDAEDKTEPAEAKVPPPPRPFPSRVKSEGVINGKAKYLPKPVYSAAALAMGVQGEVSVQVTVDENGKVISAHATNGHPMLRAAAERAALNAKFDTTYLSNVPVRVTGVITYRFAKG